MKSKFWIIVATLVLLSPAAFAKDLHYSFVEGGWASVDPDAGDSGTGPMMDVSYGLNELVHLVGGYADTDFDTVDMTTWEVGAGVHRTMSEGFDLVGQASYMEMEAEVETPLVNDVDEDGFTLAGGVRKMLTDLFEINGGVEYVDVGDEDDTLLAVNALYNVNDRFAVGAGYKMGDFDTLHAGFRVNFGKR
jgi:opacity protein-like surface antigen